MASIQSSTPLLKGTYWAREGDLEEVFRRAQKVSAEFPGDREVADFVSLVGRAADLRGEKGDRRWPPQTPAIAAIA